MFRREVSYWREKVSLQRRFRNLGVALRLYTLTLRKKTRLYAMAGAEIHRQSLSKAFNGLPLIPNLYLKNRG